MKQQSQRLLSLDTLRGFDMLFIMGGDAFFLCLGALLPGTIFADFAQQMEHKVWEGFALYDLIFPLFLFIAGVSFPFSLAKSRSVGESETKTMLRILRRGLTLVVLGMVYNYLPFMILPIYNVLAKIDNNVINAARDLGADSFQVFSKIMLPLSVPGIISGITMVFVPALTTFVISNLLGGGKILLIGNVIEQEFTKGSNWNLGAGLSIVLMIFILISMTLIAKYDSDGEGTAF